MYSHRLESLPPRARTPQDYPQSFATPKAQRRHSASPSPPSSVETTSTGLTTGGRPSSSETTAVTIYSMYGDDTAEHDDHTLKCPPTSFPTSGRASRSSSRSRTRRSPGHTPTNSNQSNGSARLSTASARLSTASAHQLAYLDSSLVGTDTVIVTAPTVPKITTEAPEPIAALEAPLRDIPRSAYLSGSETLAPTASLHSLATSPTSASRSPAHSFAPSLHRAESEAPESFHVRATYAHLDISGVPHDGVADGVERTRARLGATLDDLPPPTARALDAAEREVLASLDRYGFFRVETHDRLARLPAAPLAKSLAPVRAPAQAPPPLEPVPPAPVHGAAPPELRRIAKWGRMLQVRERDEGQNVRTWDVVQRKEHKFRERVYKGVPDRWRGAAWEVLVRRLVGEVAFARGTSELAGQYREAVDRPSTYDIQIDLDVPRTITGHVMFRTRYGLGQRSLFHVLHAFSLLCSSCGYCQGMGPIAATLLCYYDAERTYALLVHLHSADAYALHSVFAPGFPGLHEAFYVQERITERMMPAVYANFKKHMISTTSYATKWYITLFANAVPFSTQLRLWDAFFAEGADLLVIAAVAIVWGFRDYFGAPTASFEGVLSLLSSFFVPEDEDALLRWIGRTMGDKRLRADMQAWRAEWRALVREGKDRDVLL